MVDSSVRPFMEILILLSSIYGTLQLFSLVRPVLSWVPILSLNRLATEGCSAARNVHQHIPLQSTSCCRLFVLRTCSCASASIIMCACAAECMNRACHVSQYSGAACQTICKPTARECFLPICS